MIRFTRAQRTVIGTRMVHKIDAQKFWQKKTCTCSGVIVNYITI